MHLKCAQVCLEEFQRDQLKNEKPFKLDSLDIYQYKPSEVLQLRLYVSAITGV